MTSADVLRMPAQTRVLADLGLVAEGDAML